MVVMATLAIVVSFLFVEIAVAQEQQTGIDPPSLGAGTKETKNPREWDKVDAGLLGTAVGSLAIDWSQTRHIASHPAQFCERNGYLGKHPSIGKVNRYFATGIISTVGVAVVLPSTLRKFWLGGVTIVEFSAVRNNMGLGIKTRF
ncbi:MAG: hypothetical protein ACYC75_02075 [Minisyncoccota bacterium]